MITTNSCEYMSCTVFGGLYSLFGMKVMSSYFGPKEELFQCFPHENMYGLGFSYSNVFMEDWNKTEMEQLTQQRLQDGFFNMIIYTNARNQHCNQRDYFEREIINNYQQKYNPLVVVIDGSDEKGCHDFFSLDEKPLYYHLQFVREFQRAQINQQMIKWSGCE